MKFGELFDQSCQFLSLPVRGAWIEISVLCEMADIENVAPRKGSVD